MGEALAWVGQIFEWVGRFIPRWVIIPPTRGGIKFVHGSKVVPLGPGIHWYWPAVTEYHEYPVARQGVDLDALPRRDGE